MGDGGGLRGPARGSCSSHPSPTKTWGGDLPDPAGHNEQLELYTGAMAETARRHELLFVDLFAPTRELMDSGSDRKLTFNGIHLTEYGYWKVSQIMAGSLGLVRDAAPPDAAGNAAAEALRRTIYEKNYYFFIRWRGPNAEYIHGERNEMEGAENLPEEMAEYDQIIDTYDQKIWRMAKPGPEQVWRQVPEGTPVWHPTPQYRAPAPGPQGPDEYQGVKVLSPRESLRAFRLPKGYAINLYASEEDFPIANPMAMNFDAEGRLWVANTPTWPQPIPGEQPSDSIVILEDTDQVSIMPEGLLDTLRREQIVDLMAFLKYGAAAGEPASAHARTGRVMASESLPSE